ncbi:hypothetical protein [Algibacter sp. Ld11]|uniref:hypothetical protein n=1 Tax=Algibacter sp. Ld11 TaxID=649150 RepID=UPI00386B5B85
MLLILDSTETTIVFETIPILNIYALDCILIVLTGLLSISSAELIIKYYPYKVKKKKQSFYKLKNYSIFFITSLLVILINLTLVLGNLTGFGNDGVNLNASFLVQIINILSDIFLVSIAYFKFFKVYPKKNINFLTYICLSISLFLGFLSGMKENVIVPIILVLVPYFLAGNKPKLKQILIPIVLLVFLYPLNNNYRTALSIYNSKPAAFYAAVNQTFSSEIFDKKEDEHSLTGRFQGFLPFLYGASIEEEWKSFKYLNRYIYLPFAWFAPRFILPGKPTSTAGTELYRIVRDTDVDNVSITPTTYGWSYLEGGYIPLFMSFLIYALIICALERKLYLTNLVGVVTYTILLTSMIKIESDIYFRINSILQLLFIVFLFKKAFLIKLKVIKNVN